MHRLKSVAVSRLLTTAFLGLIWIPQVTYANAFRCIDAHSNEALVESARRASFSSTLQRLEKTESFILVTHQGLPIYVQLTRAAGPGLPYLLLTPGVRRPVYSNDPAYMELVRKGYGVVSFSYSRQPFSLSMESPEGRSPIRNTSLSREDLVKETILVTQNLADRGIHNVIPISLSFSSVISPDLKGFPLIVETAPMTSWAAAVPDSKFLENKKILQTWQFLNPFFGPAFVRQQLDDAYRKDFEKDINEQIGLLGLDPKKRSEFVEGKIQLTRALEDVDWSHLQLSPETRRVFIVAMLDHPRLLRNQLETFQSKVMGLREDNLLITVRNAGHFIPIQQPIVFAAIVDMVLSNPDHIKGGLLMIGSTVDDAKYISDPKEAAKIIQKLVDDSIEDEKANSTLEAKKK